MDSKERFSNRVDNYVKYRPGYPKEAVEYLFHTIGFSKDSIVADVGSGTGKFVELLAERVKCAYAVEPNAAMREAAEKSLGGFGSFHSIPASAEATTLSGHTIDFITAAQAFHWFDRKACKKEFNRILKPEGKVVLIWNERLKADAFGNAYEDQLRRHANDYEAMNHKNLTGKDFEAFFEDGRFIRAVFSNSQDFDFQGLLGRSLSSSYVPLVGEENHQPLVKGLEEIFSKYQTDGKVTFRYETQVIWGKV